MELRLALVCDDARERPDGRLDVLGILDELHAPGFPAMQQRMTVVFVMEWDAEESGAQVFRADLVGPGETRVLTIEGGTEVPAGAARATPPRTRLVLPLENVVFPRPGPYRFDLIAGGDTHGACTVHLHERPDATALPRPSSS
jgi:hypothetical protein